jgi:hypothetical protein
MLQFWRGCLLYREVKSWHVPYVHTCMYACDESLTVMLADPLDPQIHQCDPGRPLHGRTHASKVE